MASVRFLFSSSVLGSTVFSLALGVLAGCSGQVDGDIDRSPSAVSASEIEPKKDATPVDVAPAVDVCANKPASTAGRRDQVCYRWRCDGRDAKTPAKWSGGGNASTCSAGDLDADAGARAVRLVNLHRYLAGVAPVTAQASWSSAAQKCALVAHANTKLSHTPSRDWKCWSSEAAETSEVSLIANRSAPPAIGAFMEDPGNEATMVHRRWLLSEDLTRIGLGSTDRYSCVVVDGRSIDDSKNDDSGAANDDADEAKATKRGWVAWPPPGPVPMDVFASERLDEMGWTIQSSGAELDSNHVAVTVKSSSSSSALPVRMMHLTPALGSRSAIRFVPDGWKTEAGQSYEVTVTVGGSAKINFVVEPTDC